MKNKNHHNNNKKKKTTVMHDLHIYIYFFLQPFEFMSISRRCAFMLGASLFIYLFILIFSLLVQLSPDSLLSGCFLFDSLFSPRFFFFSCYLSQSLSTALLFGVRRLAE